MDTKAYVIKLELHLGGKFMGFDSYVGGKVTIFEEFDYGTSSFDGIREICKDLGCNSPTKFAFKDPKNNGTYIFFDDEKSFDDIGICIDYDKKELKICVEDGGSVDVSKKDRNNDVAEDDMEEYNEYGIILIDESSDDGLDDDDIVSDDEEFEEVRKQKKKAKEKEIKTMKQNLLVYAKERLLQFQPNVATHEEELRGYDTEYESSDDSFASLDSSEDADFIKRKKVTSMVYNKKCNLSNLKLELGFKFRDCNECKEVVRSWAIENGYNIRWKKSGCGKLQAVCVENCPWMLYASKLAGEPTCVIKTYVGEHTCVRAYKNKQASSAWLAKVIMPAIKLHPNYTTKDIIRDVTLTYGIQVEPMTCYRAKCTAMGMLRGTYEEHYAQCRSYILALRKMDSEGKFELKTTLDNKDRPLFQRIYIGFSALIKGFSIGCRKIICFDGCFLKTVLSGVLLAAVSKDCNDKMYVISWAVVEKENEDTWTWFFERLFEDLSISDGFGWTFMSDKQKGLINGIHNLAPNAEHRHCARHIYANWKKKYSGPKFKGLFWNIVKSSCKSKYRLRLNDLKQVSVHAYEDFLAQQPQSFCKSLVSEYTKSAMCDNNICETFNSYILKSREKPLIDMLEDIRSKLMSRMAEMVKVFVSSQDLLCPNIRKKMTKIQGLAFSCQLKPAVGEKYEVIFCDESHIVDLKNRSCSCRSWELSGIPCCHSMACILHSRKNPDTFVDVFFHITNALETYKHALTPMDDRNEWPESKEPPVLPPKHVKLPGRPPKKRKKDQHEEPNQGQKKLSLKGVMKMTCSKCGKFDHNKRSCKYEGPSMAPKPKGKRGRPRKNVEQETLRFSSAQTRQKGNTNSCFQDAANSQRSQVMD